MRAWLPNVLSAYLVCVCVCVCFIFKLQKGTGDWTKTKQHNSSNLLVLMGWQISQHLVCRSSSECSAKPCCGTVTEISSPWSLLPKQVFGLWFHGFFGVFHTSHFLVDWAHFWIKFRHYIKLSLGSWLRVVLWEGILPGYALLHQTLRPQILCR